MIQLDHTPTLPVSLRHYASRYGDREFLVQGSRRLSYRDVERESALLARGMLAHGIGKGTRVGILMPDSCDWVLAFFAAARIGALCVPFSTMYAARELRGVVPFSDIDTLLIADRFMQHDYLDRLEQAFPSLAKHGSGPLHLPEAPYLRTIVAWGEGRRPWAQVGPDYFSERAAAAPSIDEDFLRAVEDEVTPADLLLVIFTSGTTAEPKGVPHTHGAAIRHTHVLLDVWDVAPGDRVLTQLPLFWLGGINTALLPGLYLGSTLVFPDSRDVGALLDLIERERITSVLAWPQQFAAFLAHPDYSEQRVRTVRSGPSSFFPLPDSDGNPVPADRIANCLGMTECFGAHGEWPPRIPLPENRAGSKGRTIEGLDRIIVDPDTGERLPPGRSGELWIRGYSLTPGLYKKERHEVFSPDGYYPTGDLCTLDADGHVYFHGRLGEMVKTMGANVAPREVELVLESFDQVKEAAVLGVPDDTLGERLIAVVVPTAGTSPAAESLRDRLKGELSPYKIPREIQVVRYEQIPRSESGKVNKRGLREALLGGALAPQAD